MKTSGTQAKKKNKLCLVDGCLIVFMLLMMVYTVAILFLGEMNAQDTNVIDVVIRTSAAAIFGYFVSGNFVKDSSDSGIGTSAEAQGVSLPAGEATGTVNQIGFAPESEGGEAVTGALESQVSGTASLHPSRLQVMVVFGVGLCALVLLLVVKFFVPVNTGMTATLSQLRDFVSASIGFLVSCGRDR